MSYTQAQLLADINQEINGKIGMIANTTDFVNSVAREVNNDTTIRSSKRKSELSPDLFPDITQYALPSDTRDFKIIDIPAQAKRYDGGFGLVPVEQFNTRRQAGDIAIDDANGMRTLLIDSDVVSDQTLVSELDSLTSGGGTWTVVGGATNLAADGDDYIKGNGSLSFDLSAASQATAGMVNSTLNSFDLLNYLGGSGALFVWVKLNTPTYVTSFTLKIGSSASNYFTKTITTKHDGNAFERGWNLLRFPLTSLTETGSVNEAVTNYVSIVMDKNVLKISETDYKFDWITVMNGQIHNVTYYSKFNWITAAGAYIENSTDPSDILVAGTSEYELFIKKGKYKGMQFTNTDLNVRNEAKADYKEAVMKYENNNPDESQIMISTYSHQ